MNPRYFRKLPDGTWTSNGRARGYVFIIQLVIAGIALAASYFLAKSAAKKKGNLNDDAITTLATRGDTIPLIIGTRRTGNIFAHYWGRKSKQGVWYESGWQLICVGPATAIKKIYAGQNVLWDSDINRETSPSGSTFSLPEGRGSFRIYWGELDQPVDTQLAAELGYSSRHPFACYVVWVDFELGPSPSWPQLEYVVTCHCKDITLKNSQYLITDSSGAVGVNLAHAVLQLMCSPHPHGISLPLNHIDNDSLEAFGDLMAEEQIGVNLLLNGGVDCLEVIQGLLQDAGVLTPQVQGRIAFYPMRLIGESVPILTDDVILPPNFEREINHDNSISTVTIFTYKSERDFAYRDQDISFSDDGERSDSGHSNITSTPISSVTSRVMADKIASRRWQETVIRAAIKVTALRGARRIIPGSVLYHADVGSLRVASKLPVDKSPTSTLELTQDFYGQGSQINDTSAPNDSQSGLLPVSQDIDFAWFQMPSSVSGYSKITLAVLRTRAHQQIVGAQVVAAINGGAYTRLNNQDSPASGGLIDQAIGAGAGVVVEGPTFEDENGDAADSLDLTGDVANWQAGKQIAMIGGEVFFLQSLTVQSEESWRASTPYMVGDYIIPASGGNGFRYRCTTAGTSHTVAPKWKRIKGQTVNDGSCVWQARYFSYQMNSMIRAGFSTTSVAHAAGERVFIINQSDLQPIESPALVAGSVVSVKTNPYTQLNLTTNSLIRTKTLT